MSYLLLENFYMADLNNIIELKEIDNINDVNSLLKQGWVLLSIRENDEKNMYIIGLDRWRKFSIDHPIEDNDFLNNLTNKEN